MLERFYYRIENEMSKKHLSVEQDLTLKIEVRDQTIWTSTLEL